MIRTTDDALRQRIAELEAENARLRDSLKFVMAERRELRERVYGPVREEDLPSEEELIEVMKNRVPGRGLAQFLAELGVAARKPE
jgi:hypothetical protein